MAGLCKAVLIGHLGRDPEVRYTPDGLAVANFSVAASEKIKGQDKTEWFRVTAFGKLGEICGQYLSKGKQVYVEGRLQSNEYTDKDGNKRFSMDVIANTIQMLGSKGDTSDAPSVSRQPARPATRPDDDTTPTSMSAPTSEGPDEDIPF
jgi:single-strand DNA-binding protein